MNQPGFWYRVLWPEINMKNELDASWIGISSFLAKILQFLKMVFQSSPAPSARCTLKNHYKMAKIWQKNEEKPYL